MTKELNHDPILVLLVKFINESKNRNLSITIICNGVIITGYLISHFSYVKKLGKNFEAIFDDSTLLEEYKKSQDDVEIQLLFGEQDEDPQYLHMCDFEIVNGMRFDERSKDMALIRIKLSDVSGFMIGKWESI